MRVLLDESVPRKLARELKEHDVKTVTDGFLDRVFQNSGALVTGETRLSDFVSFGNDPEESADAVAKVREEYGIAVDIHDRLFEVLRKIPREP